MSTLHSCVMVIEDDDDFRQMVTWSLTEAGFKVEAHGHPIHALERMATGLRIGVMLVDMHLPAISGLELIEKIARSSTSAPAAILMTGDDPPRNAHVAATLRKPFEIDMLIEAVGKHFRAPPARHVGAFVPTLRVAG